MQKSYSMSEIIDSHLQKTLDPSQWVDQYGNYLYNFALGRLRNHQDSQNVVQETFLAALNAAKNYSGKSSERTWLTGILKHKIIDHMRKKYREKPVSNLQNDPDNTIQFFDNRNRLKKKPSGWLPNPEELLEKKEFWKIFQTCQSQLSRKM